MMAAALADEVALASLRHQIEHFSGHQGVIDQSITGTQQTVGLHCE
jgi:hypothetical protein